MAATAQNLRKLAKLVPPSRRRSSPHQRRAGKRPRRRRARACHGSMGMPGPPQFGGAPITTFATSEARPGGGWLGPTSRCVVPQRRFANTPTPSRARRPCGSPWPRVGRSSLSPPMDARRGVRGPPSAPIEGQHELFGFLTTEPNAAGRANSSEGHAGRSDDAGRGRPLACGRCAEGS